MNSEDKFQFWEDIYISNDTGWDLGGPTPFFKNIAKKILPKRLCVLGCGRGYDAIVFAENDFDVTAVDFSPSAIQYLSTIAKKNQVRINVLQQDIFTLSSEFDNYFDYVIEQTCFCAIHPSRRKEYVQLVHNILRKNGQVIGLWFPLDKNLNEGGPPYGTTVDEVKSYFYKGWVIRKEEFPEESIKPRKGREKLIIFEKI